MVVESLYEYIVVFLFKLYYELIVSHSKKYFYYAIVVRCIVKFNISFNITKMCLTETHKCLQRSCINLCLVESS